MADPKQLAQMLSGETRLDALASLCDQFDEQERLAAIQLLGSGALARLYTQAENPAGQAALDYLVGAEAGQAVAWAGKNSLPLFNAFAKVFYRTPDGSVIGRNTGAMEWLVGPGYYTTVIHQGHPGQFLIDYTREPASAPPAWPTVKKNSAGASFFVFRNMHDYLRPVGKNLAIGAAFDGPSGKAKGQYFALVRTTGPTAPQ
jgi:hypothetical protein